MHSKRSFTFQHTPMEDIPQIHARLRNGFSSRKTRSIAWRKQQLAQLAYMLQDNAARFEDAFAKDLSRHVHDSNLCELGSCHSAIMNCLKNVDEWTKTKSAPFDLMWFATSPKVRQEPRGVVMIISPFNYPLFTSIPPMATAIAAGNAVLLKPSEFTSATSTLLAELFPKYLDPDLIALVNGSVNETSALLDLRWDHIFFTGSARVGRIVATAAAKYLTPVTLELGGKSPVFVDSSAKGSNFNLVAKRVLWGKSINVGQTCVAPDYVLVARDRQDELVAEFLKVHEEFWPTAEGGPRGSSSYSRMVNETHFDRVRRLLDGTKGTVVIGGQTDRDARYIAPTIVKDVKGDDSLMSEEIFGPILPIVPVDSTEEALAFVNAREHPLVLMAFSKDETYKQYIFDNTQSGACMANECLFSAGCMVLPFGGVGGSGYGKNNGVYGFETFSHQRAVMDTPSWMDNKFLLGVRYPPYDVANLPTIKLMWGVGSIPYPRAGAKRNKKELTVALWITSATIAITGVVVSFLTLRKL